MPVLSEHGGHSVTWLARDVPSLGWCSYRLAPGGQPTSGSRWRATQIVNEHYRLRVDPTRGGGVSSLMAAGRELIADGRVGNELAVYDEYPAHPAAGEGPWHLLPKGPVTASSQTPATSVHGYRSALGERLVVTRRDRRAAALHADPDAVARCGPRRLPHHRSTNSAGRTACSGCAGPARCPAPCRSARSATP